MLNKKASREERELKKKNNAIKYQTGTQIVQTTPMKYHTALGNGKAIPVTSRAY
jgi:hypothetical protein